MLQPSDRAQFGTIFDAPQDRLEEEPRPAPRFTVMAKTGTRRTRLGEREREREETERVELGVTEERTDGLLAGLDVRTV